MPRAVPAITRIVTGRERRSRRVALLLQRRRTRPACGPARGGRPASDRRRPAHRPARAPARPGPGAAARTGRPPAAAAGPTAACRAGSPPRAGAGPPRRWRSRPTSSRITSSRRRDSSSAASETRMQKDRCGPRPTRPRSWCSCARPKRSASSISITLAFGTSMPTSITVVATSTSSSPAAKALHRHVAIVGALLAVHQPDAQLRQGLAAGGSARPRRWPPSAPRSPIPGARPRSSGVPPPPRRP